MSASVSSNSMNVDQPKSPVKSDSWITKGNCYFEAFYRGLGIVPEQEWNDFMNTAKIPLPIAFRVTGFRSEAKAMLEIIERDYLKKLDEEGKTSDENSAIEFTRLPWYPDGLAFQLQMDRRTVRRTPEYQRFHEMLISETESGGISRQETVSMLPPLVLDIKPNHTVLDMCAAPGSKTAQILEMLHADEESAGMALAKTRGFVIANDNDAKRCSLMVHQLKRLQSPLLCVSCHDASTYPALKLPGGINMQFDRILCDVPCSGDGTVRKNPVIWKRWSLPHGAAMHKLQTRILKRGLELLRSDGQGRLVYSTCSLNPAENEAVVTAILQAGGDALKVVDISERLPGMKTRPGMTSWSYVTQEGEQLNKVEDVPHVLRRSFVVGVFCPENLDSSVSDQLRKCIRILPHDNDTGGFFVAVFEKTGKLAWQKSSQNVATDNVEKISEECCEIEAKRQKTEITESQKTQQVKNPPQRVSSGRRRPFMNEAPPIWLQDDHEDWKQIKEFFKLSSNGEDGTFIPSNCLCSRTEGSRRRTFFLVSPRLRELVLDNPRLRPICLGVRCFARSHSANSPCDFRICQDCVYILAPYVKNRVIELCSIKDVTMLLSSEQGPFIGRLSSSVQRQLETCDVGTCIFKLVHDGFEVLMSGWRGKATCRVFVAKYERSHFLRLCGIHSNDRHGKFDTEEEKDENTNSAEGHTEVKNEIAAEENLCDGNEEKMPDASAKSNEIEGIKEEIKKENKESN